MLKVAVLVSGGGKIFHVVYFSGSAMLKEFTICAGLAVMVVCAVMNGRYKYFMSLGYESKNYESKKKIDYFYFKTIIE